MIIGTALIALGVWLLFTKQWHLNIGNGQQMFYDVPRYFTVAIGLIVIAAGIYRLEGW